MFDRIYKQNKFGLENSVNLCDMDTLTERELYDEVMKGVKDARNGKTVDANVFFTTLLKICYE